MANDRKKPTREAPAPTDPKPRPANQPGPPGQSPTGSNLTAPKKVGVVNVAGLKAQTPPVKKH